MSTKVETVDFWQDDETGHWMRLARDGERLQYHGSPEEGGHRWQQEAGEEIPRRHAELGRLLAEERQLRDQGNAEVVRYAARNGELAQELHAVNDLRERLANELAEVRRELSEHRGVWREAVRALLKETRAAASLSPLLTRDLANALLCAKSGEQRIVLVRDDLRPIAKVAERFGWSGEEPLADWLEAELKRGEEAIETVGDWVHLRNEALRCRALANAHGFETSCHTLEEFLAERLGNAEAQQELVRTIRSEAEAHGYDPAGPALIDWMAQQLDNLRLVTSPEAIEVRERTALENRQLQADLAEMRESWTSANRREEQTSRALSMLKLRVQELLELAQTALKEE